eukprot:scaffold18383_cov155-Skeletonema_marinoi.AAC.2
MHRSSSINYHRVDKKRILFRPSPSQTHESVGEDPSITEKDLHSPDEDSKEHPGGHCYRCIHRPLPSVNLYMNSSEGISRKNHLPFYIKSTEKEFMRACVVVDTQHEKGVGKTAALLSALSALSLSRSRELKATWHEKGVEKTALLTSHSSHCSQC